MVRQDCAAWATKLAIPCFTWSDNQVSRSSSPASTAASRSRRFRSRAAAARCSAFASVSGSASATPVARMEGRAFGLAPPSPVGLPAVADGPRRRASQSFTHSGTGAGANEADLSARIHISARACLQGNFRLGQVHLYPASSSLTATRYGVAPEPWHSPQRRPSPCARVGQEDGLSNFRAAASDDWSGASASILSNVNDIPLHNRAVTQRRETLGPLMRQHDSGAFELLENALSVKVPLLGWWVCTPRP